MMAGERRGVVVEAEKQLLCSGRGETASQKSLGGWRWKTGRGVHFIFSWHGQILKSYFEFHLVNPNISRA
jgi:hypothetical protein